MLERGREAGLHTIGLAALGRIPRPRCPSLGCRGHFYFFPIDIMDTELSTPSANKHISKLLPKAVRDALPPLGSTSGESDPLVIAKFFTPDGGWTWFAIEFDGVDTFYGLVQGLETEFGQFSLGELLEIRGRLGLPVERDRFFTATRLSALGIGT